MPRSLLRMSSFRRMPESSGSFVDTGLGFGVLRRSTAYFPVGVRRCDVMMLIPRPLAAG